MQERIDNRTESEKKVDAISAKTFISGLLVSVGLSLKEATEASDLYLTKDLTTELAVLGNSLSTLGIRISLELNSEVEALTTAMDKANNTTESKKETIQ